MASERGERGGRRRVEKGRGGTRSVERRTGRTPWVRGQALRSCPLAPWVQLRVPAHTGCPDTSAHGLAHGSASELTSDPTRSEIAIRWINTFTAYDFYRVALLALFSRALRIDPHGDFFFKPDLAISLESCYIPLGRNLYPSHIRKNPTKKKYQISKIGHRLKMMFVILQ